MRSCQPRNADIPQSFLFPSSQTPQSCDSPLAKGQGAICAYGVARTGDGQKKKKDNSTGAILTPGGGVLHNKWKPMPRVPSIVWR